MGRSNTWPVIVGGCHRSGTSLIRRILNAHSRIFCGPEVKFFRDLYGDYADDPLGHLRFTNSARAIVTGADLLDVLGHAYIALLERAAARAGKPRWADKCPENVLHLADWQQLLGDDWLFVHVVRNPLDTLASMKEANFDLTVPTELHERITFYRRYTESGLRFGEANPGRYYRLVYEQLVQAPEIELQNLMLWLGEALEPGQLAFNKATHQVGLEDPKIAKTAAVHTASLGRWRGLLSHDEASVVWQSTGDLWSRIDPDGHWKAVCGPRSPNNPIWRSLFSTRARGRGPR